VVIGEVTVPAWAGRHSNEKKRRDNNIRPRSKTSVLASHTRRSFTHAERQPGPRFGSARRGRHAGVPRPHPRARIHTARRSRQRRRNHCSAVRRRGLGRRRGPTNSRDFSDRRRVVHPLRCPRPARFGPRRRATGRFPISRSHPSHVERHCATVLAGRPARFPSICDGKPVVFEALPVRSADGVIVYGLFVAAGARTGVVAAAS
jgi:hypothetical protein